MPFLYDGVPDKPAWLRAWVLHRVTRRGVRREARRMHKGITRSDPEERARFARSIERRRKRYAVRKRVVGFLTNRSFTFILTLVGGPLVALQLDRLTKQDGTGNVPLMAVGIVCLALALRFDRTRDVVEGAITTYHEDNWLKGHFTTIIEELGSKIDDADNRAHQARYDTEAMLQAILARLDDRQG